MLGMLGAVTAIGKRFMPLRLRALGVGLAVGALGVVASAQAVGGASVLPRDGRVAGKGYAAWQAIAWQWAIRSSLPGPPPCATVRVGDTTVAVLSGNFYGGTVTFTCRVPAGRPIYVMGGAAECSTLEKPPFYASSAAQLVRCAEREFTGARSTASIDGQPVGGYRTLVTSTSAYPIHAPEHNVLNGQPGAGLAAARGYGLLFGGLASGTYTLRVTGFIPKIEDWDVTYVLQIR